MTAREPAAEHPATGLPGQAVEAHGGKALELALGRAIIASAHEPRPVPAGDITAFEEARRT